ncbi:hypothetical protein [Oscillatoria sp. HE19RPO]|uniref:hypothetical protein n=1 Tax=Oscillatoria sp. HE19RPO TaxID=2954806 RepID=UPI0020C280DF|nr:hypothetical protein [Oscillatoria sp. HE19RPO]
MAQILAMGKDGIVTGDANRYWGDFPVEAHNAIAVLGWRASQNGDRLSKSNFGCPIDTGLTCQKAVDKNLGSKG